MDLKKRRHDGSEPSSSGPKKKIALDAASSAAPSATPSPPSTSRLNGSAELPSEELLETFRKEAIWRQMREYKRQHDRAVQRANELQHQRDKMQSSLSAVEVCWTELVEILQLVAVPAGPSSIADASQDFLSVISDDDVQLLSEALQKRTAATRELVSSVLTSAPVAPDSAELRKKAHRFQQEAVGFREELRLTKSQLDEARTERDETRAALLRAEKQIDRAKSTVIREVNGEDAKPSAAKVKEESPAASTPKPSPPRDPEPPGATMAELEEARALVAARLAETAELRAERVKLNQELDKMKLNLSRPPDELVRDTPIFKELQVEIDAFRVEAETARAQFDKLKKQVEELQSERKEFEDKVKAEASAQVEDLRQKLAQKEQDISRLRGQREDFSAELNMRRSREANKAASVAEIQKLSESRQERIETLLSEVRRLKSKIAAGVGSETVFQALSASEADTSLAASLETQLKSLQEANAALQAQIAASSSDPSLAVSEVQLRQRLHEAEARLRRYEAILGPDAELSPEAKDLAARLRAQEERIKVLELQHVEEEAATNAIYSEVERLSNAWEILEEQNKSKVFELTQLEERVTRLTTEKAKADNKYFAAMRAKDSIDTERKVALRTHEKQTKTIERLLEAEKHLQSQMSLADKEVAASASRSRALEDKIALLERETTTLRAQTEDGKKRLDLTTTKLNERHAQLEQERAARKRTEEEVAKLRADVERATTMAKTASANGVSVSEEKLQKERDQLFSILRCSACKTELKSHCITRCMHTFCKGCIDARIETRQRKCPICQMGFSSSDVEKIHWA